MTVVTKRGDVSPGKGLAREPRQMDTAPMTQIRREYRRMGTCRTCGGPAVQEVVIIPSWGEDLLQPGDVTCEIDPTHSQER